MAVRCVSTWCLAGLLLAGWPTGCGTQSGLAGNDDGGMSGADGARAGDAGSGGQGGQVTDASLTPGVFGGGDAGSNGTCLAFGAACTAAGDCCGGSCVGNVCTYPACTSDNEPCTTNGNCCSQSCVQGACAPLMNTCKTLGNQCTSSSDCCSKLCSGGTCQASSFCGQAFDVCLVGSDCCTGKCTIASGMTLGTCDSAPPSGPANCGLVDGQLCGGSASDGGIVLNSSGLPSCGGPCCSRACAPWGPTGVLVCQPASGCHVVGDLCTADSDCCGSAGLPGGSGKPVTCDITAPSKIGICRLPMGCKPDGDVCKLKTMSCNSSCDCCSGNCETEDTCKQDNMGVPRCAPAKCVSAGSACASSASCCNGTPCVPNPTPGGSPAYVCSGSACIPACGACTDNADCCPGTSCVVGAGSTHGVCGPCGGPSPGDDGGTETDAGGPTGGDAGVAPDSGSGVDSGNPGSGVPDSGAGDSGSGPAPTCTLYGQICTSAAQCCDSVPCDGRCEYSIPR